MSFFKKLFKKKEVREISLSMNDVEEIGGKTNWCDIHSYNDYLQLRCKLLRILKRKKELPLYIGIHSKIDKAISSCLKGEKVDFGFEPWPGAGTGRI